MNGDVDVISQSTLNKILAGPNACTSDLCGQLPHEDSNNLTVISGCSDFERSSGGAFTACKELTCDGSSACASNKCEDPQIVCSGSLCPQFHCSSAETVSVLSVDFHPDTKPTVFPTSDSAVSNLENLEELQQFSKNSNRLHLNDSMISNTDLYGELSSVVVNQSDDINDCCVNQALTTKKIPLQFGGNDPVLMDGTDLTAFCANIMNMDQQLNKVDFEAGSFAAGLCKGKRTSQNFPIGECDLSYDGRDQTSQMSGIWSKQPSIGSHSDDLSVFTYTADGLPQLISSNLTDQPTGGLDVVMNPNTQYPLNSMNGSTAAKRAITGGHQHSKLGAFNRPATWIGNNLGVDSSGNFNGTWSGAAKFGVSPFSSPSQISSCGPSPNGTSPTTWNQMLIAQHTHKSNQLVNALGNFPVDNGGIRPSVNANCLASSANKSMNATSLSNIYSMFPKRPQHRMMAHWQQQQQHLSGPQPNHPAKNISFHGGSIQQMSVTRNIGNGTDLSTTSNDATSVPTFNAGSVLHALSGSKIPSSTPSSLSADSFASMSSPISTSSVDASAPLDSFKYGLDQQLIEVIKAFGSTGINAGCSNGSDVNTNDTAIMLNTVEDVHTFSETDNQFSSLNTLNHLSARQTNAHNLAALNYINNQASSLRGVSGMSMLGSVGLPTPYSTFTNIPIREEGYSRKVFVGGLPPDIDEEEITTAFRRFGPLIVDWPHKTESKAYFPPKGYCFLLFQDERSVQSLINACIVDEGKYYWCVSSPTMKDKPVQIRPWNLADSDFVMDGSQPLDPRKTIFVGGVPRPLRAIELALIMDRLYSGVCYAGIDTDPELKYPKGAGRVAFSNQQSYIAAISARFVQLQHNEIDKRVEVKPYVLDNQMCDECQGARCGGKFAPFFCANVACLQYYCEQCWVQIHSRNGREYHKPLVKEGAERPRPALYRW